MKQEIFIINGSGGCGKDTFITLCSNYAKVCNISSVDKVKEAASILTGWNGEKDEKSRKLLMELKQLSINYNNAPFKYIGNQIEEFRKSDNQLMFIHIREIDEIKKCKEAYKTKTLLITNKNVPIIQSNNSDKNVNNYKYDFQIANDGTLEDLEKLAKEFVEIIT